MASEVGPIIELVHRMPGRMRLRVWWLRDHPGQAERLADELSRIDGVMRVEVRRFTGSVLCRFDPARIGEEGVVRAAQAAIGGQVAGAEPVEELIERDRAAYEEGATLVRAATAALKSVDAQVLHFTEGRADAAMVTALAFLALGAVEIAVSGEIPIPPWFQLAWWAFRTFTTLEERTIERTEHPLQRTVH